MCFKEIKFFRVPGKAAVNRPVGVKWEGEGRVGQGGLRNGEEPGRVERKSRVR